MKEIKVLKAHAENFKKFHERTVEFGESLTNIFGQNYLGKSSIADLFSWIMFNKSSTGNTEGSQFRPRRYDENGVNVDHVDVVGELLISVDGEEVKIRKVQRQKWVRHHGDDFDSYEGDKTEYEWNDVPVSATDHKKKVEEIISEEVFRMISNPVAFPTMPAKKQREFLIENIANITNEDVFATNEEFAEVKAAMGTNTLDELIAKNKKEMDAYKKKQEEIPVRIDQESKRIEEVDFSEKEKRLEELKSTLADNEAKMENAEKAYEEVNKLKAEKAQLDGDLIQIEVKIRANAENEKKEVEKLYDDASREFNNLFDKQSLLETDLKAKQADIMAKQEQLKDLQNEYRTEFTKEMAEDALICPTCGQPMPENKADEIKATFEEKKAATVKAINEKGQATSAKIKELNESVSNLEKQIEDIKKKKVEANSVKTKQKEILDAMAEKTVDVSADLQWQELKNKITALEEKIGKINTADTDAFKDALKMERTNIQAEMDEVKAALALKSVIEKSKATVEELKAEMIQVTQSLANCEKLENAINKFNKAKMDMLSERINDKFKVVKWKLFEKQKNQRYAEVCVCMINGSCYGENTTSATERMMAGMDIINTLQEIYQVKAPIFLDDADLYNDWNIPAMDCQLIKLCVSDDEELRIEVE